jgi:multimeric flavodoxin WrbA
MDKKTRILTISGSPHIANSNTKIMVEDFVEEIERCGLELEHRIISLGQKKVQPCRGCWNCTKHKPCPLSGDDLEEIKAAMIECDMLIIQVSLLLHKEGLSGCS